MKNMPDTFSIDFACLQIAPFKAVILYSFLLKMRATTGNTSAVRRLKVSGPFLQIKSANIHRWNIFLIEALSMLASPQIKTVEPPGYI